MVLLTKIRIFVSNFVNLLRRELQGMQIFFGNHLSWGQFFQRGLK